MWTTSVKRLFNGYLIRIPHTYILYIIRGRLSLEVGDKTVRPAWDLRLGNLI